MSNYERKHDFPWDDAEYCPEDGVTFRAIEKLVEEQFLTDLNGYEGRAVSIFYGGPGKFDFRCYMSSDRPEGLLSTLLSSCQMNMWLGTHINLDFVREHKDTEQGQRVQSLLDDIYDLPHDDHEQLASLCRDLTDSYSDFLVDIAADIFKGGVRGQLVWLEAVNGFEDNMSLAKTPLKTIGAACIANLVESSRAHRAAQTSKAALISPDYCKAVKAAYEFMDDCVSCFTDGVDAYGQGTAHYMHLGAMDNYIKAIDEAFPLDFMDSLESAAPKAP